MPITTMTVFYANYNALYIIYIMHYIYIYIYMYNGIIDMYNAL